MFARVHERTVSGATEHYILLRVMISGVVISLDCWFCQRHKHRTLVARVCMGKKSGFADKSSRVNKPLIKKTGAFDYITFKKAAVTG